LIAEKLSEVATEALGYKMTVHHEVMEAQQLQDMCAFSRKDIVNNHQFQYEDKEEFDATTLDSLANQLSRYFVCMTKMESDAVVELEYSPGGDRIKKHIIRTSAKMMQTHPGMVIVTDRVGYSDRQRQQADQGRKWETGEGLKTQEVRATPCMVHSRRTAPREASYWRLLHASRGAQAPE
jgi:hypothetical protein